MDLYEVRDPQKQPAVVKAAAEAKEISLKLEPLDFMLIRANLNDPRVLEGLAA